MSEINNEQVFLTGTEVSKILGLSKQTLLKLRKVGALDTYTLGNSRVVYCAANVKAFLQSRVPTKQPINQTGE